MHLCSRWKELGMDDRDTRGEDHVANPRVQVNVVANPKQPNKFHFNEQVSKIKENTRKVRRAKIVNLEKCNWSFLTYHIITCWRSGISKRLKLSVGV